MFTQDEADRNEETTEMVAKAFGNLATYSQLTRAMLSVLTRAEEVLKTIGKRARHLSRPPRETMSEWLNTKMRLRNSSSSR